MDVIYPLLGSREYLLESLLIPTHCRLETSELPLPIDLAIVMLISRMGVALELDVDQVRGGIDLVGSTQLVVPNDLGLRDNLPPCCPDEVLGFDGRISQEPIVSYHLHVLFGGHGVPSA